MVKITMKKISDNFKVMWMVSCMLILIIPIVISSVSGNQTIAELKRVNALNNELIVQQIQKEMDFAVDNIFRVKMELISNHDVYVISSITKEEEQEHQYELSRVYDALRGYRSSVDNAGDFFIYFENIEKVVALEGIFDVEEYYRRYFSNSGKTKEQWLATLQMKTNGYFENIIKDDSDSRSERMQYYGNLRILGQINPPMFSAAVSREYLDEILELTSVGEKVCTLIVDSYNNVLLSNSKSSELDLRWVEELEISDNAGYFSDKIGKQNVMVSYVPGKYKELRYISVATAAEFWKQVNLHRGITVGGIIFSLLFGILCIWAVIKKNYRPMEHILTELKKAVPDETAEEDGIGEYRYIESVLAHVLEQKNKVVDIMERHKNLFRDSFVIRLLSGDIENIPSVEDALNNIDLSFSKENFLVLAIYVEDYSVLFQDEQLEDSQRVSMIHFILSNVLGELLSGEYIAYMVVMKGMPIFLINLDFEERKSNICGIVRYVQEFLESNFGLTIQMGFSEVKSSYEGIAEAYDEAVETVECKVFLGRDDIMYYGEIQKNAKNKHRYGYSIEQEQRLMFAVQSGNKDAANALLNQIFDNMRGITDLNLLKYFMFDVGSTVIKTIEEMNPQWDEKKSNLLKYLQEILADSSVARMQRGLQGLIQELCEYFASRNKEERLSDRIRKYVLEHYDDINLNVEDIGEKFGFVPRYISKIFKDETGEGLLDYINRMRIQESKKIMKNKNLVLEDVASQVGFTNVNSFIRVFKKYEGITPGKYREAL